MPTPINVRSSAPDGDAFRVRVDIGGVVHVLRVRDDADLDRQVQRIEAAKGRTVTLGAREVADVVVVEPKPPTQDEIDRAAFSDLVGLYRTTAAEVKAGVGKSTQADLDAMVADIKATYRDEYAPLLVGVF
jgi:hypothetical protein